MKIEEKEAALRQLGELDIQESLEHDGYYRVALKDANQCELASAESYSVDLAIEYIYGVITKGGKHD